jgi:uncharacterized protein (TIGR03083 family)
VNQPTRLSSGTAAPDGLSFARHIEEITTQTDLLRATLAGADMTVPVPSCPGWNVGQLARHLGGAHRWLAGMVAAGSTEAHPDEHFRDLTPYAHEDPAVLDPWLAGGAALLTGALREAGPDGPVWVPLEGLGSPMGFSARRMAHETAIHRSDATLALGAPYTVEPEVAVDGMDEWMTLGSLPQMFDFFPERRELLGPGRTLHLHATDTAPELAAEWVVDLTGDALAWRRAHEKAAVAVRAPLTELLLMVYRRRPVDGLEVLGDAELLDFWLDRVSFG